jgi:NAD+ synthase
MPNDFDTNQAITNVKRFLTGNLLSSGLNGFVIGVSGGVDSAVSVSLAVEAVGKEKVLGLMLPYRTSSDSSVTDARKLVEKLGIEHRLIDISPMVDAYFPIIDDSNRLRAGNKMARERMSIVFDVAAETKSLVLGSGNRTEICLGYTTWHGDSACSVNPVGEMYKGEIRLVAAALGVPDSIITKAPSADLWEGQTDEGEIGITYERIDRLLEQIIDGGQTSMSALTSMGFDETEISRVVSLINLNSFKRKMPPIAPLGRRAVPELVLLKD